MTSFELHPPEGPHTSLLRLKKVGLIDNILFVSGLFGSEKRMVHEISRPMSCAQLELRKRTQGALQMLPSHVPNVANVSMSLMIFAVI